MISWDEEKTEQVVGRWMEDQEGEGFEEDLSCSGLPWVFLDDPRTAADWDLTLNSSAPRVLPAAASIMLPANSTLPAASSYNLPVTFSSDLPVSSSCLLSASSNLTRCPARCQWCSHSGVWGALHMYMCSRWWSLPDTRLNWPHRFQTFIRMDEFESEYTASKPPEKLTCTYIECSNCILYCTFLIHSNKGLRVQIKEIIMKQLHKYWKMISWNIL